MSLVDVKINDAPRELPDRVSEFCREAHELIDQFIAKWDGSFTGFVPSDFPTVYWTLEAIHRDSLAVGRAFCEWGSGVGVITSLASMLHYDARGIEIERNLVEAAEELAERFELPVEFECGTFIPSGGEEITDYVGELSWLAMGGDDAYDAIGLDVDDFDVIFAYPWPGEETVIFNLFDRYAAVGALLVTYHGMEGIRVQRKTGHRFDDS